MSNQVDTEKAIRCMVKSNMITFAQTFSERHISEVDNPNGTLNMKIHNVFISALGDEFQYYTALSRSFDSSLGNMLETLAVSIARLFYEVSKEVEGYLYPEQTAKIAELLEAYKNRKNPKVVCITDYNELIDYDKPDGLETKVHDRDYLYDKEFWSFICQSEKVYEVVIDEYKKNYHIIKKCYNLCLRDLKLGNVV